MTSSFGQVPRSAPGKPEAFTLHISDQDVTHFKALLELSKVGPKTWWNEHTDGSFGISRDWLIKAKDTWIGNFDWRQQEAHINSFPNFKIGIDNPEYGRLSVHFW
ncbi:epoxide hydrolase family protein [Penicillium mononematosum]|uniref:epoxide hydrolase family protein n=1 Tax=Penicillium mononematosum TaxID=268346 RepID=UPI00254797D3|nr:epoxide hydrolase family protein [Penicillium mononematosum]KAJ6178268.1 epoxide hydrolase family protein [Penicillium mononematosum]